jgi:hypothetical protein
LKQRHYVFNKTYRLLAAQARARWLIALDRRLPAGRRIGSVRYLGRNEGANFINEIPPPRAGRERWHVSGW